MLTVTPTRKWGAEIYTRGGSCPHIPRELFGHTSGTFDVVLIGLHLLNLLYLCLLPPLQASPTCPAARAIDTKYRRLRGWCLISVWLSYLPNKIKTCFSHSFCCLVLYWSLCAFVHENGTQTGEQNRYVFNHFLRWQRHPTLMNKMLENQA